MTLHERSLTDRERAVLDFESGCRLRGWAKEEQIRETLGMSPARYYQLLGRLIDSLEAQEYDPLLIARLRRLRERSRATARTRGFSTDGPGSGQERRFGVGTIV
ncbi:hypothetical protein GCM10009808_14920 [Microbacterium sediminicola]|uniref:DUF3263 domain-containing protein n=1 Tax=Microbacterium sediminicola TaxID=415210 RepID=A0ABN2I4D1_9MICO